MTSIESVAIDVVQRNGSMSFSSCSSFFTLIVYFVYWIYCLFLECCCCFDWAPDLKNTSWDTSSAMFLRSSRVSRLHGFPFGHPVFPVDCRDSECKASTFHFSGLAVNQLMILGPITLICLLHLVLPESELSTMSERDKVVTTWSGNFSRIPKSDLRSQSVTVVSMTSNVSFTF